jgi:CheY-like chemotaxis protein
MGWFMSGVSQSLRDGVAAAQARQFDRARPLLEQATTESPSDPVGWFWLAIASPSAGAAMRCLRRVLELEPAHEQARNGLVTLLQTEAQRLAAAGARAEALDLAAEATRLAPNSQSVWLSIAALTDDQKERIEALRKAVAITPDDAQLRTRLRQALLARGVMPSIDRAEARACFKEAAAINPNDPRVWQALAKLADTPAEAVDALRELIRVAPEQAHGQFALRNALAADARALTEAGRTDDARARWQEIISTANNDIEAWLGVAATTSNEDEAVQAVEMAHRLNPAHEQVIEAKARLERLKIDPATVEAPVDAFARFDAPADVAAPADDPFAQLDSTLDAFARLEESAATAAPALTLTPAAAPTIVEDMFSTPEPTPEPMVNLASALEETDQPDQALSLDFDTVFEAGSSHQSPVLSLETAVPSLEPAVPSLEPAVLSLEPAIPSLEPAVLSLEPAVPSLEPAVLSLEPAVLSLEPAVPSLQAADVAAPAPAPAVAESAGAPAYSSSRKTVMIVDDSPTIRKILGLTLERAGYKVVAEPDGESAIERLIQVVPDLILLDIAMPKIDGYEVCKRIKQDPRTKAVPVVMLSGKGALFDKVKGHMAGAIEYLTKPFETPAVLAVVANYCEKTAEVVNG